MASICNICDNKTVRCAYCPRVGKYCSMHLDESMIYTTNFNSFICKTCVDRRGGIKFCSVGDCDKHCSMCYMCDKLLAMCKKHNNYGIMYCDFTICKDCYYIKPYCIKCHKIYKELYTIQGKQYCEWCN